MNYLCVCQYGHSRSVACARGLHGRGVVAVACGWMTAGSALPVLCEWADKIIVLCGHAPSRIPTKFHAKLVTFPVGSDKWSNPYHPELQQVIEGMISNLLPDVPAKHPDIQRIPPRHPNA